MATETHEYQTGLITGVGDHAGGRPRDPRARTTAENVLTVLAARHIDVSDEAHARITACTDLGRLCHWLRRAATIDSPEDLFTAVPSRPQNRSLRRRDAEVDIVRRYLWHGRVEGRLRGTATAVLAVLDVRGVAVAAAPREWITGSRDLVELENWLRRAATAGSIVDVLGELADVLTSDEEPYARWCREQIPVTSVSAARHGWEEMMAGAEKPFVRRIVTQGRAYGALDATAWAITAVLHARGIELPEGCGQVFEDCDDLEQLTLWLRRAVCAGAVEEVTAAG